MSIPVTPQYNLFRLNLATAGQVTLEQEVGVLHLWRFEDASGAFKLSGEIAAQFSAAVADAVPMTYNSRIEFAPPAQRCILSWAAQAATFAVIMVAAHKEQVIGENVPVTQLVTGSLGASLNHGAATVNTTATLIRAASSARQSLAIQNRGLTSIYLGGSGVTVANGLEVMPGAVADVNGTSAAIYGITASGSCDVRYFEGAT